MCMLGTHAACRTPRPARRPRLARTVAVGERVEPRRDVLRDLDNRGRRRDRVRAWSHCRFVPPPIHFIPDSLGESVPLFLKRHRGRAPGHLRRRELEGGAKGLRRRRLLARPIICRERSGGGASRSGLGRCGAARMNAWLGAESGEGVGVGKGRGGEGGQRRGRGEASPRRGWSPSPARSGKAPPNRRP